MSASCPAAAAPAATAAASVSVVSAGNWLMSFDRVGPRVLGRLGDLEGADVELSDLGTGGLALVDQLRGQELVIVVDACAGQGPPGAVLVREPDLDAPLSPTVHQIGPSEALTIARRLYPERLPRTLWMVLVETAGLAEIDEESATAAAEAAVRRLVQEYRQARATGAAASEAGREA